MGGSYKRRKYIDELEVRIGNDGRFHMFFVLVSSLSNKHERIFGVIYADVVLGGCLPVTDDSEFESIRDGQD